MAGIDVRKHYLLKRNITGIERRMKYGLYSQGYDVEFNAVTGSIYYMKYAYNDSKTKQTFVSLNEDFKTITCEMDALIPLETKEFQLLLAIPSNYFRMLTFSSPLFEKIKTAQEGDIAETARRVVGIIRHIGPVINKTGFMIGLELKFPDGDSNGTVDGVEYFDCDINRAQFVTANEITNIIFQTEDEYNNYGIRDGIFQRHQSFRARTCKLDRRNTIPRTKTKKVDFNGNTLPRTCRVENEVKMRDVHNNPSENIRINAKPTIKEDNQKAAAAKYSPELEKELAEKVTEINNKPNDSKAKTEPDMKEKANRSRPLSAIVNTEPEIKEKETLTRPHSAIFLPKPEKKETNSTPSSAIFNTEPEIKENKRPKALKLALIKTYEMETDLNDKLSRL